MKNAIIAFGFGVVIVLCVLIHSVITAKDISLNETEKSLNNAIEQTLDGMTIEQFYSLDDANIIISELGSNLIGQLSSDSTLDIQLIYPDYENGKLTLKFIQTFDLANGNSYIKVYEPPKISAATAVARVEKSSDFPDLINLFSVKATVDINGEEKQVDSSNINVDTELNTEIEGMYLVTFKTTYVYTTEDGVSLQRDGILTTRVLVE